MATIKNFPNNADEFIGAEYVMKWLHGRTSGVFGADQNLAVSVPGTDGMAVEVSDGLGWLANAGKDGTVFWLDNQEKEGSKLQIPISIADPVLPRITRVVVSWSTTDYVDKPEIIALDGTPNSNPQPPALTNDTLKRQISLAQILVPAAATSITSENITDERLDPEVCGLVTESLEVDTSMMKSQFEALLKLARDELETLRQAIADVEGDTAWMLKAQYDPAGLGKDVTTQVYTHSKSSTVHEFTGSGAVGRALMTADVEEGDTFTVNGELVTAYMGAEDATGGMAGSAWNGKWVTFVFDGQTLNFCGGGAKYEPPAYSTSDAVDTGVKWADGKPIFMRTISVPRLPSSDGAYYGIDDVVDTLIRLDALVYWQDGMVAPLPFVSSNATDQIYLRAFNNAASSNKNTVRISVSKDNSSQSAQITVFYTRA